MKILFRGKPAHKIQIFVRSHVRTVPGDDITRRLSSVGEQVHCRTGQGLGGGYHCQAVIADEVVGPVAQARGAPT